MQELSQMEAKLAGLRYKVKVLKDAA
jgi:hypothetical protein